MKAPAKTGVYFYNSLAAVKRPEVKERQHLSTSKLQHSGDEN